MKTNLKSIRKSKGMTQDQLAQAVGASKRQIGAWERGENELPIDYAYAIADKLDCTLDDIAGRVRYAVIEMPKDELVTSDEQELLKLYRGLPERGKHAVIAGLRDFAERQ